MDKTLLITRPKHDSTVRCLFYWTKEIVKLAEEKGIKVWNMEGDKANRKEVESILKKRNRSLVFLNGHGDDGAVAGHDDEILVEAGDNEDVLNSKITYALSCRSGKKLGPKSIEKGAKGYIGYDDDFIFIADPNKIADPLSDQTAGLFFEASNQIMTSLLKGHSIKQCHDRSLKIFAKNAMKVSTGGSKDYLLATYLLWNAEHQVCLGNQSSSL